MTMFSVRLIRIKGNEPWEKWGDDWQSKVKAVMTLEGRDGWSVLAELREMDRERRQLDWGAFLFRVSKQELLSLYGEHPTGMPWAEERDRKQWKKLSKLKDREYGLVVVELY